jgi:hypothetical protein
MASDPNADHKGVAPAPAAVGEGGSRAPTDAELPEAGSDEQRQPPRPAEPSPAEAVWEEQQRIRPAWERAAADAGASPRPVRLSRVLLLGAISSFGWQILAAPLGVPEHKTSRLLEAAQAWLAPLSARLGALMAEWCNPLTLVDWLRRLVRPVAEEFATLAWAFASFLHAVWGSAHEGFFSHLPGVLDQLFASVASAGVVLGVCVLLEVLGARFFQPARPTYWVISLANALYEGARGIAAAYCAVTKLVFSLRASIEALLRRIPWLRPLSERCSAAARLLVRGLCNLAQAGPKGFWAGVGMVFHGIDRFRSWAAHSAQMPAWDRLTLAAALGLMAASLAAALCLRADCAALAPFEPSAIRLSATLVAIVLAAFALPRFLDAIQRPLVPAAPSSPSPAPAG